MSVQSNSQSNPQLLQQRLTVREQEISALKVQNRHLLTKLDELEKQNKPSQIDTQLVANEMRKHLDPVISQLQNTITSSFEILQSTMRGIYQQSSRAQQAVEDMAAQTKDLEARMAEQRRADQNFYQDKIFSTIGSFCDRIERQIDVRLKSLAVVEVMNNKQNEVLNDIESMSASLSLMHKTSEAGRGEISRLERQAEETNEKLIDVQVQTRNSEELVRDTLQQVQNHRAEFRLIRADLKATLEHIGRIASKIEDQEARSRAFAEENARENAEAIMMDAMRDVEAAKVIDENDVINEIIENKHRELEALEKNIEEQTASQSKDDATMILALLRAQKTELQKVAAEAKSYLKGHQASLEKAKGIPTPPEFNSEP